jgi:hypothetical protein
MPFASIPQPETITRRDRRRLVLVGVLVLAIFIGAGIWAAVRPGGYGSSRNGCVTVSVPSSTGGGLLHGCGSRARAMCRSAYASGGTTARLTRQQCRLAGIAPPERAHPPPG